MIDSRHLAAILRIEQDHADLLFAVIAKHYPDIFNLKALNDEASYLLDLPASKRAEAKGAYFILFEQMIAELRDKVLAEEVVPQIEAYLSGKQNPEEIFRPFIAKEWEDDSHKKLRPCTSQVNMQGKLATGTLRRREHLTPLDMMAAAWNIVERGGVQLQVLSRINLPHLNLSHGDKRYLINVSKNPEDPPRWVAVDPTKECTVYSEFQLYEEEKRALQVALHRELTFAGGTAAAGLSSGYAALGWMGRRDRAGHFTENADFWLQRFQVYLYLFPFKETGYGSNGGPLRFCDADEVMFSPEYRSYREKFLRFSGGGEGHCTAYFYEVLEGIASNGKLTGEQTYDPYHLVVFLRAIHDRAVGIGDFNELTQAGLRLNITGLERTFEQGALGLVTPPQGERGELVFSVPTSLTIAQVLQSYEKESKRGTHLSGTIMFILEGKALPANKIEHCAVTLLLNFLRGQAQYPRLRLDFPDAYRLQPHDIYLIRHLVDDNSYITQIEITSSHPQLLAVVQQVAPSLARNRWLAYNQYKHALTADYWSEAAMYWVRYLHEHQGILQSFAEQGGREHQEFKDCVQGMGQQGLTAVLQYLNEQQSAVRAMLGKHRPEFYVACAGPELQQCADAILAHLADESSYFPFSSFGIAFYPDNNPLYLKLIQQLNALERFDRVVLTNLEADPRATADFLRFLLEVAQKERWTSLIVMPEFEGDKSLTPRYRELRALYCELNNVVLANQRIERSRDLREDSDALPEVVRSRAAAEKISVDLSSIGKEVSSEGKSYPLTKQAMTEVNFQQDQQLQQDRQLKQEQEVQEQQVQESPLEGELVTYETIDALLGDLYRKLSEARSLQGFANVRRGSETVLQALFRTWIGAAPEVSGVHIVNKISMAAAKQLLLNSHRFAQGIALETLPRGFYTQLDCQDKLVLCYSVERGYAQRKTPFTLNLDDKPAKAEAWCGDYRQLPLVSMDLDARMFQNLLIFELCQPEGKKYKKQYDAFMRANTDIAQRVRASGSNLVLKHWPVFLQLWQTHEGAGVEFFHTKTAAEFDVAPRELLTTLLGEELYKQYQEILAEFSIANVRALGQAYYQYGLEGVRTLLGEVHALHEVLGRRFYVNFKHDFLDRSNNHSELLSFESRDALRDMQILLQSSDDNIALWCVMVKAHMEVHQWDSLASLWRAFAEFCEFLADNSLSINPELLERVNIKNMLVAMDRIRHCIQQMPNAMNKQIFLDHLDQESLEHGGLYHAFAYEGFTFYSQQAKLQNFDRGEPTYAPDLKRIYDWRGGELPIRLVRALSREAWVNPESFDHFYSKLETGTPDARKLLVLLLTTQYDRFDEYWYEAVTNQAAAVSPDIAKHLHAARYHIGALPQVNLSTMVTLSGLAVADLSRVLASYPRGTFLEAVSLMANMPGWQGKVVPLKELFLAVAKDSMNEFELQGLKLAAICNQFGSAAFARFSRLVADLSPAARQAVSFMLAQVLSIDFEQAEQRLLNLSLWGQVLTCIEQLKDRRNLAKTNVVRVTFIEHLQAEGYCFKTSAKGDYRQLQESDEVPELRQLGMYQGRLWQFLLSHIVIPKDIDPAEALHDLAVVFARLHDKATAANEIDLVLARLEKQFPPAPNQLWTAEFFASFLQALQPRSRSSIYPISLLDKLLKYSLLQPKPMAAVVDKLPQNFAYTLHEQILLNTNFSRKQQLDLVHIFMHEFAVEESTALLTEMIAALTAAPVTFRSIILSELGRTKDMVGLTHVWQDCQWLIANAPATTTISTQHWAKTIQYWITTDRKALLERIKAEFAADDEKLRDVLHIITYTEVPGAHVNVDRKLNKLVVRLNGLTCAELRQLAALYPGLPAPAVNDILALIKAKPHADLDWNQQLQNYLCNPHPFPRQDYGSLAATRSADVERVLRDIRVRRGYETSLSSGEMHRLLACFNLLKRFEDGKQFVSGTDKPIKALSKQEINAAIDRLLLQPLDDWVTTEIFALLFEVLFRTNKKYPHIAQQMSFLANRVAIHSNKSIMQLSTGEGKSIFVALTAKRQGKQRKIDVSTAKRGLAARDHEEFAGFYAYLGLTSGVITPASEREDYERAEIHFSTAGDYSLFFDRLAWEGYPLVWDPDEHVIVLDEVDSTLFDEDENTQYNFAAPKNKSSQELLWFYGALNQFYYKHQKELIATQSISAAQLTELVEELKTAAGDDGARLRLFEELSSNRIDLVQWIQSTHVACHLLEQDKQFVLLESDIAVGEEVIRYLEIVPVSLQTNQPMRGSSFSDGVQQVLAFELNRRRAEGGRPQNVFIPQESNILSSEVASTRIRQRWSTRQVGCTGTISATQADFLHQNEGVEVLYMPTNRPSLRKWHAPRFYDSPQEKLQAVAQQVKRCFEHGQSILFACKDDIEVKQLQKQLQELLSPAEYAQFVFVTNEQDRDQDDILQEKYNKEAWKGGKKQRGVALVGSGMGRGDNLDVEAVILLGLANTNDCNQKGGRTARNGEFGEVFRFYNLEEIESERVSLTKMLVAFDPAHGEGTIGHIETEVRKNYQARFGDGGNEAQLKAEMSCDIVIALREKVHAFQIFERQGFYRALAEYSSWGMEEAIAKLGGHAHDHKEEARLRAQWATQLRRIQVDWLDIVSQLEGSEARLDKMRSLIRDTYAKHLREAFASQVEIEVPEFVFSQTEPHRSTPPEPPAGDPALRAAIWMKLSQLGIETEEPMAIAEICKEIDALNDERLKRLSRQMHAVTSVKEFRQYLTSVSRDGQLAAALTQDDKPVTSEIVKGLGKECRTALDVLTTGLIPSLKESLLRVLVDTDSDDERTQRAIDRYRLLIDYLHHLNLEQQEEFGEAYLAARDRLLSETTAAFSAARFSLPGMSFDDFSRVWSLIVASKGSVELLQLVGRAVAVSPTNRLRILTQWEELASLMPKVSAQDKTAFLSDICKVMMTLTEGVAWDTFEEIFANTRDRWLLERQGEQVYQAKFVQLWQLLAKHNGQLPAFKTLIDACLKQPGKAWLEYLLLCLNLETEQLQQYADKLAAMIERQEADPRNVDKKKSCKIEFFALLMQLLTVLKDFPEEILLDLLRVTANLIIQRDYTSAEQYQLVQQLLLALPAYPGPFVLTLVESAGDPAVNIEGLLSLLRNDQVRSHINREGADPMISLVRLLNISKDYNADEQAFLRECVVRCPNLLDQVTNVRTYRALLQLKQQHNGQHPQLFAILVCLQQADFLAMSEADLFNRVLDFTHQLLALQSPNHDGLQQLGALIVGNFRNLNIVAVVLESTRQEHRLEYTRVLLQHRVILSGLDDGSRVDSDRLQQRAGLGLIELVQACGLVTIFTPQQLNQWYEYAIKRLSFATNREDMEAILRDLTSQAGQYTSHNTLASAYLDLHASVAETAYGEGNSAKQIFDHCQQRYFDFKQPGLRLARINFMHLSHEQNFFEPRQNGKAQNHELFYQGLNQYAQRAKQEPATANLLALSQELQASCGHQRHTAENPEMLQQLQQQLQDDIRQYQGANFKSSERKQQLSDLLVELQTVFRTTPPGQRYSVLLQKICEAKRTAMLADERLNQNGFGLFPVNRSGRSRYIDMLDQMALQVRAAWSQDPQAISNFGSYTDIYHNELAKMLSLLQTALRRWLIPTYQTQDTLLLRLRDNLEGSFGQGSLQDYQSLVKGLAAKQVLPGDVRMITTNILTSFNDLSEQQLSQQVQPLRADVDIVMPVAVAAWGHEQAQMKFNFINHVREQIRQLALQNPELWMSSGSQQSLVDSLTDAIKDAPFGEHEPNADARRDAAFIQVRNCIEQHAVPCEISVRLQIHLKQEMVRVDILRVTGDLVAEVDAALVKLTKQARHHTVADRALHTAKGLFNPFRWTTGLQRRTTHALQMWRDAVAGKHLDNDMEEHHVRSILDAIKMGATQVTELASLRPSAILEHILQQCARRGSYATQDSLDEDTKALRELDYNAFNRGVATGTSEPRGTYGMR